MIDSSRKISSLCSIEVKKKQTNKKTQKTHQNLDIIRKRLENKLGKILISYELMIVPILELSVQFWLPHSKKNTLKWEKVQRKIPKVIKRLK